MSLPCVVESSNIDHSQKLALRRARLQHVRYGYGWIAIGEVWIVDSAADGNAEAEASLLKATKSSTFQACPYHQDIIEHQATSGESLDIMYDNNTH